MLNIPDSVKALCKGDGVRKNFRARFPQNDTPDITNSQVVQESVRFTESICSQDVLKFGLTEASMIEFETVGVGNLYGMWMECFTEIDVSRLSEAELAEIAGGQWVGELVGAADSDLGWPFYRIPYGRFRVESCPRNQQAMTHRRVTAYSARPSDVFPGEDLGLTSCIYPEIRVDMAALTAALDKGSMTAYEVPEERFSGAPAGEGGWPWPYRGMFLNPSGTRQFVVDGSSALVKSSPYYYYPFYRLLPASEEYPYGDTLKTGDFVEIQLRYDKNAYEAAGKALAQQMTDAGVVLYSSYSGGNYKIYKNNEEALRDKCPELFSPVICYNERAGGTANSLGPWGGADRFGAPCAVQRIVPNKLTPILGAYRAVPPTQAHNGFEVTGSWPSNSGAQLHAWAGWVSGFVRLKVTGAAVNSDTGQYEPVYDTAARSYEVTYPPVEVVTMRRYEIAELSGTRVTLKNTGKGKGLLASNLASDPSGINRYSYEGAAPLQDILDGWLELNAAFGKSGRGGGLEMIRLSVDNPVAVAPGEYQSFWWDEYDVEPIGTVTYKFKDKKGNEQEGRYRFGPGASVYSMTDNAALQMLTVEEEEAGKAEDAIKALLDARFIPHLLPIAFTPIDLTMQGLPYLEDGDYLSVTAGDGTAAVSFNMRHELSGIQLQAGHVTSVAGQIIADDGEVYGG